MRQSLLPGLATRSIWESNALIGEKYPVSKLQHTHARFSRQGSVSLNVNLNCFRIIKDQHNDVAVVGIKCRQPIKPRKEYQTVGFGSENQATCLAIRPIRISAFERGKAIA